MAESAGGADPAPAGTVLQIGCGVAAALPRTARRHVLVEPDPAALRRFERDRPAGPEVHVIAAALAAERGSAPFLRLKIPRLSGLCCPPELFELMPGLRPVAEFPVETRTLGDILEEAAISGDGNVLVCENPGVSAAVLEGLAAPDALALFPEIELVCSARPLFGPGTDAEAVERFLEERGYRLTRCDDADPDWPRLGFRRDPALEAQRVAEAEAARQRAALAEAEQAAETMRAEAEALRSARDSALEAQRVAEAEATRQRAALAEAEQAAETLRQDLSLALRLQTMAQTDLQELQTRHAALMEEKTAQDVLLSQLLLRLEEALEHLHRLGMADDTAAGEVDRLAHAASQRDGQDAAPGAGANEKAPPRKGHERGR